MSCVICGDPVSDDIYLRSEQSCSHYCACQKLLYVLRYKRDKSLMGAEASDERFDRKKFKKQAKTMDEFLRKHEKTMISRGYRIPQSTFPHIDRIAEGGSASSPSRVGSISSNNSVPLSGNTSQLMDADDVIKNNLADIIRRNSGINQGINYIPDQLNGYRFSYDERILLHKGYSIKTYGLKREDGRLFTGTIRWIAHRAVRNFRFDEVYDEYGGPVQYGGYTITADDVSKLEANRRVFVKGLTYTNGSKYNTILIYYRFNNSYGPRLTNDAFFAEVGRNELEAMIAETKSKDRNALWTEYKRRYKILYRKNPTWIPAGISQTKRKKTDRQQTVSRSPEIAKQYNCAGCGDVIYSGDPIFLDMNATVGPEYYTRAGGKESDWYYCLTCHSARSEGKLLDGEDMDLEDWD